MIRIGILSNPRSHRNKRGLDGIARLTAGAEAVMHRTAVGPDEVDAVLHDFAAAGIGLIVLNGGDGTVQAALTTLFGRRPFAEVEVPPLAVLRGGMTNLISLDVGLRGRREGAVARLLKWAAAGGTDDAVVRRRLIRLEARPGAPPLYGMFFGTAAMCRAIRATRSGLEARGIEASAAAAAMLAGIAGSHLLGRHGGDAILSGDPIAIGFDGAAAGAPRDWLLAMVTTLDRLILRSRPYWGEGPGGLRFTGIHYPPRRLLCAIPSVLRGRGTALGPDYVSRNADSIALTMACPYTLDGELFTPAEGEAVTLSDGGEVRFVQI